MKIFILTLIFLNSLFAVTLEEINSNPRSISKDFFIWLYLKQNISPKQAEKAFYQAKKINNTLLRLYAKKTDDLDLKKAVNCMNIQSHKLSVKLTKTCLALALSPYKATKISKKKRLKFANYLKDKYPNDAYDLKALSSNNPAALIHKDQRHYTFLRLYNSAGSYFRQTYFNRTISKESINELVKQSNFDKFIIKVVTNTQAKNIEKSLLKVPIKSYKHHTNFFLALSALKQNKIDRAISFLQYSLKTSYKRADKDKSNFWLYLATKDKSFLKKIENSWSLNIYTLYARELLGKELPSIPPPLLLNNKYSKYDVSNPFDWEKIFIEFKKTDTENLEEFSKQFLNEKDQVIFAYLDEKISNYKNTHFIMPYNHYMKKENNDTKARINALARQESRFIPSSLSTSYAMGVMQIMPFLSKTIAKRLKEDYNILSMLEAEKSVRYGVYHLRELKRQFKSQLFIAYAYNAGAGFFKSRLKQGFFKKNNPYEPFMSMELIPYNETRNYGKKVLANYIIYKNLLKEPIKVQKVLDKALVP